MAKALNKGSNGTTCTFGGTTYTLNGVSLKIDGQKVDITDFAQASMIYKVGLPDYEITLDITGSTIPTVGTAGEGAVVLTWNDQAAAATLPAKFTCTSVNVTAKLNDKISSTATLVPTIADT